MIETTRPKGVAGSPLPDLLCYQRTRPFQPFGAPEIYSSASRSPIHPSSRFLMVERMAETNTAFDVTVCGTVERSGHLIEPNTCADLIMAVHMG